MSRCWKQEKDKPLWRWITGSPGLSAGDLNDLNERFQGYKEICCGADEEAIIIYANNSYQKKVDAYNITTMNHLWGLTEFKPDGMKFEMKPSGITTDGQGHLFICDMDNKCIHIFYTDGTYMCPVDCNGKVELGIPERIDWSKSESALVVTHRVDSKCFISVLKIQIHPNSSSL